MPLRRILVDGANVFAEICSKIVGSESDNCPSVGPGRVALKTSSNCEEQETNRVAVHDVIHLLGAPEVVLVLTLAAP